MKVMDPMADSAVRALLRDPHFEELKEWIIANTGLSYYADKDRDLASAVCRCSRHEGCDAKGVLHLLKRRQEGSLDQLVEELTIGETFFFRHLEMFHALRNHVLPDLIKRRSALRSLRIWSAGCSVGAEPYSLAILLNEMLAAEAGDWTYEIVATDINRRFLALARAGVYDSWALRGMEPGLLQRAFHRVGARWRINDVYRKAVTFRHHNLVKETFPSLEHDLSGLDLVICRNVIIYFDAATNRRLADQFYRCLVPGGWLAVGHAEPHTEIFKAFHTVNAPGAVLYQRAESPSHRFGALSRPLPAMVDLEMRRAVPPAPVVLPLPPSRVRWVPPVLIPSEVASSPCPTPAGGPAGQKTGIQEIASLADAGDLERARVAAEALTAAEPLHEGAYLQLGLVYYQLGKWERARLALKRALYLARDLEVGHYYLGLVQLSLGQPAMRSFQNARKLVMLQPDDTLLRWGDGMTAGELRLLLQPYHEGVIHEK